MRETRFLKAVVAAVLSLVMVFASLFIELAHTICDTPTTFSVPLLVAAVVVGIYAEVKFKKLEKED